MHDAASSALAAAAAMAALWALTFSRAAGGESAAAQDLSLVEHGRYLTAAADCAGCHTEPGRNTPFAGGRRIETPFGFVAAPNITPDRDTGIGKWTDSEFERALRQGTRPDGKRLYPAMPFGYYTRMTKEDVLAIRAYLNTVPPIHHAVHANQLPFPFSIRAVMRLWDALYFRSGVLGPDPTRSAAWNRGAYLVEGPGHCAACHSPKNLLGADRASRKFRGYALQGWFAPDITNDFARGLGNWSLTDIAEYLRTGHNRVSAAAGPMGEEVENSSSNMNDADLAAIATYLKAQPGQTQSPRRLSADDRFMKAGAAIYADRCSACHKSDGAGVPYLIPDLAASSSVASREPLTVLRVVLRGAKSVATADEPTGAAMPAFGWQLTDEQTAAVTTYIRNSWGHGGVPVTARDVSKARRDLAARND